MRENKNALLINQPTDSPSSSLSVYSSHLLKKLELEERERERALDSWVSVKLDLIETERVSNSTRFWACECTGWADLTGPLRLVWSIWSLFSSPELIKMWPLQCGHAWFCSQVYIFILWVLRSITATEIWWLSWLVILNAYVVFIV